MKLGTLLSPMGFHVAAWRHPGARLEAATDVRHYAHIAQLAERAKFDLLFLADTSAHAIEPAHVRRRMALIHPLEPLTLLSALSVLTTNIGLVASVSTTYNEPYRVARAIASLDHLSAGRGGWNVVTSANPDEAFNFNREAHVEHADRYDRAAEFTRVVRGLWDTWDDDALAAADKETGIYYDANKVRALNHRGKHFSVAGPLNVPRPPQGHPVIAQAGSSEPGRNLGAGIADIIFTAQLTFEESKRFYDDLKGRAAKLGRDPEHIKIMPGIVPVVGRTQAEADEKFAALQELIHPDVGLMLLSDLLGGVDLTDYPLDGPLPKVTDSNANKSRLQLIMDLADREQLTIRQLYQHAAGARAHRYVKGTAQSIADDMEHWFRSGVADGFCVIPLYLPDALDDFATWVVPELRRRGLFRHEYEGRTLRENLGVPRPNSR
jgi:FMN-dependent oxidoreductase (nitrilotriacetate monooxygenase family)